MRLEQAKVLAQNGHKVVHEYFTSDEYMTMRGNIIQFEDGAEIFFDEWIKDKDYLKKGWNLHHSEIIQIVKHAKKHYIDQVSLTRIKSLLTGMCHSLHVTALQLLGIEFVMSLFNKSDYSYLEEIIPLFKKDYFDNIKQVGWYWWELDDFESRLHAFNKLITSYERTN